MRSGRTNTDMSTNTNATQRTRSLIHTNHGKASQLEVWQVARAATAAKFYFEPLKIENARDGRGFTEFTDGGFGHNNNPTRRGKEEIEERHGPTSIGIVVSVGTARKLKKDVKKATFFSTIPNLARESIDQVTDPEVIHQQMKRNHQMQQEFPYFRLNHKGALQIDLDEWEPKRKIYNRKERGAKTIADIESAFNNWAAVRKNTQKLEQCAAALVARRRGRMNTTKWERYATGSHFECPSMSCDPGDIFDRNEFKIHLQSHLEDHELEGDELEEIVSQCRKHWRYQAAPKL